VRGAPGAGLAAAHGRRRRGLERLTIDRSQDAFELDCRTLEALLDRPETEVRRYNSAGADRVVAGLRDARCDTHDRVSCGKFETALRVATT
jgi:hypothetical protein